MKKEQNPLSQKLYEIIFEADTPAGKAFDVLLIICILLSVGVVMLESVAAIRSQWGPLLHIAEWFFTILFTFEYILRLYCVRSKLRYAISFFGIVDLLAILPTYLGVFTRTLSYLRVIRILRVLRVFRVLKLGNHLKQADLLGRALYASRQKILVFISFVLTIVVIIGSIMYLIETPEDGFTSIPRSIYWAIVTLTTVGYGDISPQTPAGQFLAALVMLLGYSIIAVPTGIVTVEMSKAEAQAASSQSCPDCGQSRHEKDAVFCRICGSKLL